MLLHGASSSGEADFGRVLPALRGGFRCHVPDARGHGGTRWDAADGFRYEWLVDDVLAFVDALGLETFHLLGFSMGGATALGFAVRHPGRLRTLVLAGIAPERQPRASVARRLFDADRIEAQDPEWASELSARHDPVQGPGAWQRLLPAIARDVASQELQDPPTSSGSTARCCSWSAIATRSSRPTRRGALKRQLPDARLLVAPDCGHEVLLRRPALAIEALAGFYRSTEVVAARRAGTASDAAPGRTRRRLRHHDPRPTSARTSRTARSHPTRTGSRRRPDDRRPRALARQRGVPRG